MLEFFSQTQTLLIAFLVCIAILPGFSRLKAKVGDGPLLDVLLTGAKARKRLADMTPEQKKAHLIGSATLDMIFPFAYGILFAGLIYRFGGADGALLALLPLACIVFDLAENLVHISALADRRDLLGLKVMLTGPKIILLLVSIGTSVLYYLFP